MTTPSTRQSLIKQITSIQRMERGKLCVIKQGPEGPYYSLQSWENGRNETRYVPRDQLPVVQANLAAYEQFQSLVGQYAQEIIQQTRAERLAGAKKKDPTPEVLLAQDQEIQNVMARFKAQAASGRVVQQLEILIRTAIFKSANQLVGSLLQQAVDEIDATYHAQPGQVRKGRETVTVQGIFGTFVLTRDYYYHAGKKQGHYPADAALGLEGGYTPALARLLGLEGADEASYQKAEMHLLETGGISVSARQIQRLVQSVGADAQAWQEREVPWNTGVRERVPVMYLSADGSGVPMRPEELVGREGQQPDGTAKTRQAYLGCVFTQHGHDEKGHPVRDWQSTTYVSSLAGIDDFGPCLRREALRRGMGGAERVVVLIDGAKGLAKMGEVCFPGELQIVDYYHAVEHAGKVLVALLGSKEHPEYKTRQHRWAKRLLRNGVNNLIEETRREAALLGRSEAVEEQLGYFVNNVERMQYGTFRKQGLFIGSGVIEAGCKTVIGARCKQSGMFWGKAGAENVLALRCIHASQRLDQFWLHRSNDHAARNDTLPLAA